MQKTLKKLGFPQVESAATAASSLPKIGLCLTRRMDKLDECSEQMDKLVQKYQEEGKASKTVERKL